MILTPSPKNKIMSLKIVGKDICFSANNCSLNHVTKFKLTLPPHAFQEVMLKINSNFIFKLLCGALKCFMKAFEGFIKPFQAPKRNMKIKI